MEIGYTISFKLFIFSLKKPTQFLVVILFHLSVKIISLRQQERYDQGGRGHWTVFLHQSPKFYNDVFLFVLGTFIEL